MKSSHPFGRRRFPSVTNTLKMIRWAETTRGSIERAVDISDLRELARRRTPGPIFDFIDGGAGDETSLRRNESSFTAVKLVPRILRDVSAIDTSTRLLGHSIPLPLALAPVGLTRMAHRDGEVAAASAASRNGIPYCLSTMASASPELIVEHAPNLRRWFQLYLWRDRAASMELIQRAELAGFETLVITLDVPVAGARLRDMRHELGVPPSVPPRTAMRLARHPSWLIDAITLDPIAFAAIRTGSADFVTQANSIVDPSATLAELEWLRDVWPGSIIAKGILSSDDAAAVVNAGVDGVIVSNHGGRQLENAISPLEVLGEVRDRLGPNATVLIDGGIRSGAHVAAAIAAGADAVLVGRPYLYGLMAGGEDGALRAIDVLRDGLVRTMALLGAPTLADLVPTMVRLPTG